jgi:hypothetical protein
LQLFIQSPKALQAVDKALRIGCKVWLTGHAASGLVFYGTLSEQRNAPNRSMTLSAKVVASTNVRHGVASANETLEAQS